MRVCLALFILTAGCASVSHHFPTPEHFTSSACAHRFNAAAERTTVEQLNEISHLFKSDCHAEVLQLGEFIRKSRRDKIYMITAEFGEIFTPEGTFTEYVLESYERAFLSLLMAVSHLRLGKESAALVELRRAQEEERAVIYNYGADPALALLQAALWDRFDVSLAQPYWKALADSPYIDSAARDFANARWKEIETDPAQKISWRILGFGSLPELDWSTRIMKGEQGPYRIFSKKVFPNTCANAKTLLFPTRSWVEKIAAKYDSDYHPFTYFKSLMRLPVGLGYGVVGVSTGVAVGAGGCGADMMAKGSDGSLCKMALHAGGYIISKSADIVEYTLKPDLRHWKELPIAIYLNRERENETESAARDQTECEVEGALRVMKSFDL